MVLSWLQLVSSAAVFWDVMQHSPRRNGCSQPNHIRFHCVCGLVAVCWTDQSHNWKVWMTKAFAQKSLRCKQWVISGFCLTLHTPPKNVLCSRARIMTDRKNVNESPKYNCYMYSSICSAKVRLDIFWKSLIVSVNQGLKASYRLKTREQSTIQNLQSTNQAKLLDFLVPLLGKLK